MRIGNVVTTKSGFVEAFKSTEQSKAWSDSAIDRLFEYLIDIEAMNGVERELNAHELVQEFRFYTSVDKYNEDYGTKHKEVGDIYEVVVIVPDDDYGFIIQHLPTKDLSNIDL